MLKTYYEITTRTKYGTTIHYSEFVATETEAREWSARHYGGEIVAIRPVRSEVR